jgi:catechol 2,3-dioxygenase-like lactoylglutathione lyase family enzyme
VDRPRIRHVAINAHDRDAQAEYYKNVFGMVEKSRGPNGTIYLSDGFVDLALINDPSLSWGLHHFGFQVEDVKEIEKSAQAQAVANTYGAVAESWLSDPEDNRVDVSEGGWPV